MVRLLIVDDEQGIRELLRDYFTDLKYEVHTEADGEEAVRKAGLIKPHLIFIDFGLPNKNGLEAAKEILSNDHTVKIIMITGMSDPDIQKQAMECGVHDFIRKPFKLEYLEKEVLPKISSQLYEELRRENTEKTRLNEELKKKLEEIRQLYDKLKKTSIQTIMSLAIALESKDQYTHGHSLRVSVYSIGIAQELKNKSGWDIDEKFIENIEREALLHDIGKVGMPDSILRKPERLTQEEYDVIKNHPEIGARILQPIEDLRENIEVILHHHESYNGTGYPSGLRAGDGERTIPERSRILSVADAYDAMTSGRPYRTPLTTQEAVEKIKQSSGSQFDPSVVEAFIAYLKKQGKI